MPHAGKPEHRQAGRKADRDDDDAHGLHDGDGPHVGTELGGKRQHLRQPARRGREVGSSPSGGADKRRRRMMTAIATIRTAMLSG